MPRGGRRTGIPGTNYSNRTDLQSVKAAPGQAYGVRGVQEAAQKVVPMAGATSPGPSTTSSTGPSTSGMPAMLGGPPPGLLTPLDAPTERPDEPITAGMAMGPGAGPEANPFANIGSAEDAKLAMRAVYAAYPSEEIRAILERLDVDG